MTSNKATDMQGRIRDRLPSWQPVAPRLERKSGYVLSDLLRFDDSDFIEVAYLALLRRPSDEAGRSGYLNALRSLGISKVEILGRIRFSEEGRKHAVHVDGLLLPYKLHQWRRKRVIGSVLGFALGLFRLPRLALRLQSMEAHAAHESQNIGRALNRLDTEIEQRLIAIETAFRDTIDATIENSFVEFARTFIEARAAQMYLLDPEIRSLAREGTSVDAQHLATRLSSEAFKRAMYEEIVRRQGDAEPDLPPYAQQAASKVGVSLRVKGAATGIAKAIDAAARDLDTRMAATENALQGRLTQISTDWRKRLDARAAVLESHVVEQKSDGERARRAIERMEKEVLAARRDLLHANQRIDRVADSPRRKPALGEAVMVDAPGRDEHALDSFYVSFEDRFRGNRELVAKRAEPFLPIIKAALDRAVSGGVLDIGCGRGEWLQLLNHAGVQAQGIDLNEVNVIECRAAGLDVQQAEAVAYLRALEDASLAGVTGMHIVEHMSFPALVALFDEVYRVLKPGGVVLFETPNPENLAVGTCDFYLDPTHRHPLPPPLLEYTAWARGFENVEIHRLSEHRPLPSAPAVEDSRQPNAPALEWLLQQARDRLCVAPDYAVVAWKGAVGSARVNRGGQA